MKKFMLFLICAVAFVASLGAMTIEEVVDLKHRARLGDAEAQFEVGCCYYEGDGVPKNLVEAVKWYQKAAEQGHAGAKQRLQELGE
ncbi:MAG: SEL1-like repeat protein [Kiritimatiellae bacterium]|nr:SEL1-like repeat protein [Kiritimatiellia bacterium]